MGDETKHKIDPHHFAIHDVKPQSIDLMPFLITHHPSLITKAHFSAANESR
jgi:hypothetical protein